MTRNGTKVEKKMKSTSDTERNKNINLGLGQLQFKAVSSDWLKFRHR